MQKTCENDYGESLNTKNLAWASLLPSWKSNRNELPI